MRTRIIPCTDTFYAVVVQGMKSFFSVSSCTLNENEDKLAQKSRIIACKLPYSDQVPVNAKLSNWQRPKKLNKNDTGVEYLNYGRGTTTPNSKNISHDFNNRKHYSHLSKTYVYAGFTRMKCFSHMVSVKPIYLLLVKSFSPEPINPN